LERAASSPPNLCFCCRWCDGALYRVEFLVVSSDIVGMSRDEISDFRPRPGRVRDRGGSARRRSRSFVAQVMRAASKANGGPLTFGKPRGGDRNSAGSKRNRKGRCSRIGRGQAAADRLKLSAGQRGPGQRMRRVVIKARIVRLKIGSRSALAHLSYLQRDGTTRDGGRGQLYGPDSDRVDGPTFAERGQGDRHQFRFIVAPEDGRPRCCASVDSHSASQEVFVVPPKLRTRVNLTS
jgi:hypothetical protein